MFGFLLHRIVSRIAITSAALVVMTAGCGMKSSLPVGEPEEVPQAGYGAAGSGDDVLVSGIDAASHCGNGKIEPEYGEQCDGTDLGGATCNSLGEGRGRLRCGPNCRFDLTMCAYQPSNGGYGDGGPIPGPGPGTWDGGPFGPIFGPDWGTWDGGPIGPIF